MESYAIYVIAAVGVVMLVVFGTAYFMHSRENQ